MPFETWLAFVLFWGAFEFLPGPNTAFAVGAALANPLPRALMAPIGLAAAGIAHITVGALGLSAIMLASAEWFSAAKWLGVAYLVWLGLRCWWRAPPMHTNGQQSRGSALGLMAKAALVCLSNPKSIYWSMAVVPQFLSPGLPFAPQVLVLALTASAVSLLVYTTYVVFAAPLGRRLTASGHRRMLSRVTGSLYLAAAGALAIAGQKPAG